MPYGRPSRFKPRAYKRYRSARTIQRGWRARKRRRTGGLVARTALSNRRQIKKINRSIETKMIELVNGTLGNQYSGQYVVRVPVDDTGFDSTGYPLAIKPYRGVEEGTEADERTGDWVKAKSLTYKIYFQAVTGLLAETNHIGCYIVLDRDPLNPVVPNLCGMVPGTLDAGSVLGGNSQHMWMRFQNMATCGKTQRFKVLKHIRRHVQTTQNGSINQPSTSVTGTLKLPYNLKYTDATATIPDRPLNQELVFLFYSDSNAAPHPNVSMHCRFRFKDA